MKELEITFQHDNYLKVSIGFHECLIRSIIVYILIEAISGIQWLELLARRNHLPMSERSDI
jgi:hypothetical protein